MWNRASGQPAMRSEERNGRGRKLEDGDKEIEIAHSIEEVSEIDGCDRKLGLRYIVYTSIYNMFREMNEHGWCVDNIRVRLKLITFIRTFRMFFLWFCIQFTMTAFSIESL